MACLALVIATGCSEIAAGQSVTLSVGVGQETVGGAVVVPIKLVSSDGAQVSAIQWSLNYSPDVTGVALAIGPAALNAGKSLKCSANSCVIYGINQTVISDGVLATATFRISPGSSALAVPIRITGIVAATSAGDSIPAVGVPGMALLAPALANPNGANSAGQPVLTADSVSPIASGGVSQTFTFVFSNSQIPDLAAAAMLFSSSPAAENSCFIVYVRDRGTIQLESDDLTNSEIKSAGSSSRLQNSQCSIDATSVTATSLATVINLEITFTTAFTGRKNIYMYGASGDGSTNTGWTQRGFYTVADPAPPIPTVESVSPDSGTRVTQTFSFVFSDSQDAANLTVAGILFSSLLDVQNSCYVVYARSLGTIQLEWDDVTGADVKPAGSSTPLQNSQCAIGATSVTASGLSTRVNMEITFTGAFTGPKNVYMYAADGDGSISTGWVQKGTWTLN